MADVQGYCDDRFRPLRDLFESNLDSGIDEGGSLAATLNGEFVVDLWGGARDRKRTRPWERDTLGFVFSTGKVMVNITILMMVDRDLLDLDAPIATYWPEFGRNGKHGVTTRQVLTHQSGVPGFGCSVGFTELHDWDHMVGVVEDAALWFEPGTASCYAPIIYGFILGELVHRLSGQPFDRFFASEIAGPLGADFHFGVRAAADQARVSQVWFPDAAFPSGTELGVRAMSETEPGEWVVPDRMAAVIPAANGNGNARSMARIGAMLAMGGELDGRRYLRREIVEEASREQSYAQDAVLGWCRLGLGFGLDSPGLAAPTPTTFHWGGYGGSCLTMDMATGLSFGFVPNRLRLGDEVIEERLGQLWSTVGEISRGLRPSADA